MTSTEKLDIKALAKKYGYEEYMVERFAAFVPGLEKFLASMEAPPRTFIRVNTLKIPATALLKRLRDKGFTLSETDMPDCYEMTSGPYSIGASAEHLTGNLYVQDMSSLLPSLALAPVPGELVVDMAASPGGKSTHLAQLMQNQGTLVVIEKEPLRMPGLLVNLGRCGVMNSVVYNMDATELPKLGVKADKILLDAPCTGEGVIAKDKSRKTSRAMDDIMFCSNAQRDLVDAAVASLKPGGALVYSTCSFAPEEDELIVDYAVKKHGMKVEPLDYGLPGITSFKEYTFDPQVKNARRMYPHVHGTLGFFVARLRHV